MNITSARSVASGHQNNPKTNLPEKESPNEKNVTRLRRGVFGPTPRFGCKQKSQSQQSKDLIRVLATSMANSKHNNDFATSSSESESKQPVAVTSSVNVQLTGCQGADRGSLSPRQKLCFHLGNQIKPPIPGRHGPFALFY